LFAGERARRILHRSIALTRDDRPFDLVAIALLPDHLHLVLGLPDDDADFPPVSRRSRGGSRGGG
jgi:putative transposase